MGRISSTRVVVLTICFVITSVFIYRQPLTMVAIKQIPLSDALFNIKGWKSSGLDPFDKKVIESLNLDDYTHMHYSNGKETVSLYIGYYLSTKKLGALHDPLVCFPGQGWQISDIQRGRYEFQSKINHEINYSTFIAQRGVKKELVIYWFQSYDKTNPDTFSQKITSCLKKASIYREDNAFVRLTMTVEDRSLLECREIILRFIRSFYPTFLEYVKEDIT